MKSSIALKIPEKSTDNSITSLAKKTEIKQKISTLQDVLGFIADREENYNMLSDYNIPQGHEIDELISGLSKDLKILEILSKESFLNHDKALEISQILQKKSAVAGVIKDLIEFRELKSRDKMFSLDVMASAVLEVLLEKVKESAQTFLDTKQYYAFINFLASSMTAVISESLELIQDRVSKKIIIQSNAN